MVVQLDPHGMDPGFISWDLPEYTGHTHVHDFLPLRLGVGCRVGSLLWVLISLSLSLYLSHGRSKLIFKNWYQICPLEMRFPSEVPALSYWGWCQQAPGREDAN